MPAGRLALLAGLLLAPQGCRDLDRFDTGASGAYCGQIIDSAFTRRGFDAGLGMRLTLDIDLLQQAPGTLSTNDTKCAPQPLFDHAPLQVTPELFADPLSLLEFGATRDANFVAWVDSTCQGSALAVVSLMHTGDVEVRLLRRGDASGEATPGDFGVFQLKRTDCEL
ncbi:MAG: hypothetical protein ABI895_32390 [Deltaproteobacteria bacterium]